MAEAARKQENGALAKREASSSITGTFHNAAAIDARLESAQRQFHLVSPFTAAGALPDGCGIQITLVQVDKKHETYPTGGGKLGLGKNVLDRIAHALGISWDPRESRRLDDGRDPHYVHYKAVGHYRASDGQLQTIQDEKEFDVREGSPQLNGKTTKQIAEMRTHALSHAITKARLRAIRSLGVRTGYEPDELDKPFACARVVFTGRTQDPELRRDFSRMTAASFLGGSHALYGAPPRAPEPALTAGHAPPPVGTVPADEDFVDVDTGEVTEAPRAQPAPATQRTRSSGGSSRGNGNVPTMRFGKSKGKRIDDEGVPAEHLEWYAAALTERLDDPEAARFREGNERTIAAIEAELARRNGEDGEGRTWDDEEGFPS